MKKWILFLSLFTLVYLEDFTLNNQDPNYPCTIRNMFGKVKLSITQSLFQSANIFKNSLIPFNIDLKRIKLFLKIFTKRRRRQNS